MFCKPPVFFSMFGTTFALHKTSTCSTYDIYTFIGTSNSILSSIATISSSYLCFEKHAYSILASKKTEDSYSSVEHVSKVDVERYTLQKPPQTLCNYTTTRTSPTCNCWQGNQTLYNFPWMMLRTLKAY